MNRRRLAREASQMVAGSPERVMTKQDWKALYVVHRLGEQVVLHGSAALDDFISAMVVAHSLIPKESRPAEPERETT